MPDASSLVHIGIIRSPIKTREAMPAEGVTAEVEIYPAFAPAMAEIESNSHLIIIGWLHQADRSNLQARGKSGNRERGVFGLRSSSRPNPLGMDVVRLLHADHVNLKLEVDGLDFIDGTPVVDIKRYSAPWDSVFAARTERDQELGERTPDETRDELVRSAVNFHGEWCRNAAIGVKLLTEATGKWHIGPRNPALSFSAGGDGCIADALQGMTGATLGNGRFRYTATNSIELRLGDRESWVFDPTTDLNDPPEELVKRRLEELGNLSVRKLAGG